jgi:hypothetical protein
MQVESQRSNLPEYRIGTGTRFGQYKNIFKADFDTPPANDARWVCCGSIYILGTSDARCAAECMCIAGVSDARCAA